MSKNKLTAKQEMFCREYIIDFNATQAAIRAGYSKKTAGSVGGENLKKPEIMNRVNELTGERTQRVQFDADEVLRRLAILSRSNIKNFAKPDGHGGLTMHVPDDISDDDMYCISELTTEEYDVKDGEGTIPVKKTKIKFVDKLKAIEVAGKHVGVQAFAEKKEVGVTDDLKDTLDKMSDKQLASKLAFVLASGLGE